MLRALNPCTPWISSLGEGLTGITVLGAVVLVVTGGEALYADMGHFGRRPIRLAWFALVLPALVLNYFGQGALLLDNPGAARTRSMRWCRLGAVPHGGHCDGGGRRGFPGADLRRVFADPPGDSAGLFPRMKIMHTSSSTTDRSTSPR